MLNENETRSLIEFINKFFGLDLSENLKPIAISELNKFKKIHKIMDLGDFLSKYRYDLQDDKILVFEGYDTLKNTLIMANELINAAKPIKNNMLKMANKNFTTATDFADYLVKEKKLSFRDSYSLAAKLVNFAEKKEKS